MLVGGCMKVKNLVLNVLIITAVFMVTVIVSNYSWGLVSTSFEPLNQLIELDDKVYVQHKEPDENGFIYDSYILTSNGEKTAIYEVLNLKYTAGKQWTRDGLYIDDPTLKVVATAPEDYVKVKEGEEFFVRLYGIGSEYKDENGSHITSPIVFFNDKGENVGWELSLTASASTKGVTFTVPEGATKMYVSNYTNRNISVQRKKVVTEEEFEKIKEEQNQVLNSLDSSYAQIEKDPIIYKKLDKAYITFVNDDATQEIDKFADLFIENNIPLCLAAIADNLPNYASSGKETRLDAALRVQEAGGEILAHNVDVITQDTIDDTDFMYKYFVTQKKLLTRFGLKVQGMITAGGRGQITGDKRSAKWVSSLYAYSDLLGERHITSSGIDSVYYHNRIGLGSYGNDLSQIKQKIDSMIENKEWGVFYFHGTSEISIENLKLVMDYINSKSDSEVEIVTYSDMYQKHAVRESTIKKLGKTYYVSANGTSTDGTNINQPMNLDTLNAKKLNSGDTVLLKRGDTFFGTIKLDINHTDDRIVTLSSYGEGDLPTISTYKYITANWEPYDENIYRIDISNPDNYTGYSSNIKTAYDVGFLEDDRSVKYYNKKVSIERLENNFDFYSDRKQYLYMYLDYGNPKEQIGNLKAVIKSNLMLLDSNMNIKNIRFSYSGGNGIEGNLTNLSNVNIEDCIIENIGGSYESNSSLTSELRYGNGIDFYNSNASNIHVQNNIIRNIYDVAFMIQRTSGSGENINVHHNIMVNNSQDAEIWGVGTATGIVGYKYYQNISINQGRGWGYEARPNPYVAAAILIWEYNIENTDIEFKDNMMYNPRRIYFVATQNNTTELFKQKDKIKSDYNTYYLGADAKLFREEGSVLNTSFLASLYNKDMNSTFNPIEVDNHIIQVATTSDQLDEIRGLFSMTEPEEVVLSGLTYSNKEYDGLENEPVGTLKVEGDKVPIEEIITEYSKYDGTTWNIVSKEEMKTVGKYKVKYKIPDSNSKYIGSVEYQFEILKATPSYIIPTNLEGEKGSLLSSVILPEGFLWKDAHMVLEAGTKKYSATYIPTDTDNYHAISTLEIPVKVKNVFSVTTNVLDNNGTILEEQNKNLNNVLEGTTLTFMFIANEGYQLDQVFVNGGDQTLLVQDNKLKLTVTENTNITVSYKRLQYVVTINYTSNLTVTPNGVLRVNYMDSQEIGIVAHPGYQVVSVFVNGIEMKDKVFNQKLILSNIAENQTVIIKAEKIKDHEIDNIVSPHPTPTPNPTPTPSNRPVPTPSTSPVPTDTPMPSKTSNPTKTPNVTQSPTPTHSPNPTHSPKPTQSLKPTPTPTTNMSDKEKDEEINQESSKSQNETINHVLILLTVITAVAGITVIVCFKKYFRMNRGA